MPFKFTKQFFFKFEEILKSDLPGFNSHLKLFPSNRNQNHAFNREQNQRISSVLIILYNNPEARVLFTLRNEYKGVHSAQVSFPGGKMESFDNSTLDTALRETYEEINIQLNQNQIVGQLSQLYIPPSNYLVFPYIAFVNNLESVKPNPNEVAEIFSESIQLLMEQSKQLICNKIRVYNNEEIIAPGFWVDGKLIWGATAMILQELLDVIDIVNHENKKKC